MRHLRKDKFKVGPKHHPIKTYGEWRYSSTHSFKLCISWWLGRFTSGQGKDINFYSTSSTPALGHTEPPIQWVSGGKVAWP
jgi:hypothetical protein